MKKNKHKVIYKREKCAVECLPGSWWGQVLLVIRYDGTGTGVLSKSQNA
jgi:hypothetical protein